MPTQALDPSARAFVNAQLAGMPTPTDEVLRAYRAGYAGILLTGRSLYDLVATADGRLLTLVEELRRRVRAEHGMLTVVYSLANGFEWDAARVQDQRDRTAIETALLAHHLLNVQRDEHEMVRVIRGISSIARAATGGLAWADGTPMRFLFLLEFAEHLAPCGRDAARTDQEITAVELAHILGQSNALRQSGNLVIFHGREGMVDELVTGVLHPIRLAQPTADEKKRFLNAARNVYVKARFEAGTTEDDVARLTTNTPNRGLESRLRASHRLETPVTIEDLLAQKSADVVALSEGTLTVLDTRRIDGLRLVGRSVETALRVLNAFGDGLLHADPHIPSNVILVGPPGSGKTDLALVVAMQARASAYQVHSPKGGIVGETERKARRLTTVLAEWIPNVAFVDEITEALPLERNEFDGDSGASRAVNAALLTALSDESRRGRSLLVATTNCPWRMSAAMRSRFTMIPVLGPVREDFPALLCTISARIAPETTLREDEVREGAEIFYNKGATAREIRAELSLALLDAGRLTPEVIRQAARDLCPSADRVAAEYADLWAVKACTSKRYLPWYADPAGFPFPEHLQGLVDLATGELNMEAIDHRLEVLKPRARV